MRRSPMLAVVLAAALSVGVVAVANATQITSRVGDLVLTFGGSISPKKLPKAEYAPIVSNIFGKIATSDGTHPSALRETVVDVDKDIKVSVKGYPVCSERELTARNTSAALKVCGNTVLGEGIAHAEIRFPEQPPIKVTSPVTVFNGGEKGGKTTLLIHTFITVPAPTAIVTKVTISRKGSGLHTIAKIPVIAGGSGSVLDFSFKLGKTYSYKGKKVGYLEARCPDGAFKVAVPKTVFKNEADEPGVPSQTVLKDVKLALPCTPKG
jgi:hypothetical protein